MTKRKLAKDEIETHLNLMGDDRDTWHVSSDDVAMQKKLESIGAVLVRVAADGVCKFYTLRADQIVLRKGKKQLSSERKAQLGTQNRARLKNTYVHDVLDPRIDASEVAR